MSPLHPIANTSEIAPGQGKAFAVGKRQIAIFHLDGEYFAINDYCPHMGASLSQGYVEDYEVSCAWHAWRFDVRDGTWCDNRRIKTDSYPVTVEGDQIYVEFPDEEDTSRPE